MNQIDFRKRRILGSIAYLFTFALWMYAMADDMEGVFDVFVGGIISVFAAALTFPFVAIGLLILFIPVRIALNLFGDVTGIRLITKKTPKPDASTSGGDTTDKPTDGDGGCCGEGDDQTPKS